MSGKDVGTDASDKLGDAGVGSAVSVCNEIGWSIKVQR
jgi:hypothetical protein